MTPKLFEDSYSINIYYYAKEFKYIKMTSISNVFTSLEHSIADHKRHEYV